MIDLSVRLEERTRALLEEKYPAFVASYDKERVQGLRLNSLKSPDGRGDAAGSGKDRGIWEDTGAAEAVERVRQETGPTPERIPWVKEGYYYSRDNRPGGHPYHEARLHYIQGLGVMAVVELLDPRPRERMLDSCAAPGGRSGHTASRMKGTGSLLSNEIYPTRAGIFSQNMEQMGVRNAVMSNENTQNLAGVSGRFFHKIVVDAPRSGEGIFRKDEGARSQWSKEHVKICAARQSEILDYAAAMLTPGGEMVYSTCIFAPEEDEGTILASLRCHPEFRVEQMPAYPGFTKGKPQRVGLEAEGWDLERALRIMPHVLEGEGHFIAVLREEGDPENTAKAGRRDRLHLDSRRRKEASRDYEPPIRDALTEPGTFLERKEYVLLREQLYLMPTDISGMEGFKILRPGLHLGTLKENRFEPSHALALALRKEEAQCSRELPPSGDSIIRYLKSEAPSEKARIFRERLKGWVLVCTDGFSLGRAEYAGDILENHYPKGLRRN